MLPILKPQTGLSDKISENNPELWVQSISRKAPISKEGEMGEMKATLYLLHTCILIYESKTINRGTWTFLSWNNLEAGKEGVKKREQSHDHGTPFKSEEEGESRRSERKTFLEF